MLVVYQMGFQFSVYLLVDCCLLIRRIVCKCGCFYPIYSLNLLKLSFIRGENRVIVINLLYGTILNRCKENQILLQLMKSQFSRNYSSTFLNEYYNLKFSIVWDGRPFN